MSAILDVLIGVTFVFLLSSLVVTATGEICLSLLDKRAALLKEGLEELLKDGAHINTATLLQHGLISSLSRGTFDPTVRISGIANRLLIGILPTRISKRWKLTTGTEGVPSYIPGKSFVLAVLALLVAAGAETYLQTGDSLQT